MTPERRSSNQIKGATAVSNLDIGQAMPLLGERVEALREEIELLHPNRQLPCLGSEDPSYDTDQVADIEPLQKGVRLFSNLLLSHVDLDAP